MVFCLFPNFERPDIYICHVVSFKIGSKLLSDNYGIFEMLINNFKIKHGKLWIEGYHGQNQDPRKNKTVSPNHLKYYQNNANK